MEWHLVHTIIAAVSATFGLLMDLQALFGALSYLRSKRGSRPVRLWPVVAYAVGALVCDGSLGFKAEAFAAGLMVHLVCTVASWALVKRKNRPRASE